MDGLMSSEKSPVTSTNQTQNTGKKLFDPVAKKDLRQMEELFRGLFEVWFHPLKAHARYFTGDEAAAKDIVQDAFTSLWMLRDDFDFDRQVAAYLYRSVHHRCISFLRHRKLEDRYRQHSKQLLVEAEKYQEEQLECQISRLSEPEYHRRLQKAINALPPRPRQAFLLSRQSHLSNKQIAEEMEITVKAVERNMTRALAFLKEELKDLF